MHRERNRLVVPLIFLVLILLIIDGVYVYFTNSSLTTQPLSARATEILINGAWKTVSDDKSGISIDVPQDFDVISAAQKSVSDQTEIIGKYSGNIVGTTTVSFAVNIVDFNVSTYGVNGISQECGDYGPHYYQSYNSTSTVIINGTTFSKIEAFSLGDASDNPSYYYFQRYSELTPTDCRQVQLEINLSPLDSLNQQTRYNDSLVENQIYLIMPKIVNSISTKNN